MEANKDSAAKRRSKKIKTIHYPIETLIGESCDIPQNIVEEILVRLPAKSLLKFKCVAKSWFSLISSSKFIKAHLIHSSTSANYRFLLGVSYDRVRDNANYGSVSSSICDLFTDDVVDDVYRPNIPTEYQFKISSSCNGLLCVSVYHKYYSINHAFLWNPCSRVSKKLPPVTKSRSDWIWESTYGIGYDEPSDDYKVVGIFNCVCRQVIEIYILKNGSWKRIEGFEGSVDSISSVIYANGKFNFSAYFPDGSACHGWNIVGLDLENEVYGTIEQPNYEEPNYVGFDTRISIGVLQGCISALYSCVRSYDADFWVLKEYGVKESWTKLVSIPYDKGPKSYVDDAIPCRMCTLWSGKYLLVRGRRLVVYDPEECFAYPLHPQIAGNLYMFSSAGIYAESLLPLPI